MQYVNIAIKSLSHTRVLRDSFVQTFVSSILETRDPGSPVKFAGKRCLGKLVRLKEVKIISVVLDALGLC